MFAQCHAHKHASGGRCELMSYKASVRNSPGADLHRLVRDMEECVVVNKCMETGVINYRCGNVV